MVLLLFSVHFLCVIIGVMAIVVYLLVWLFAVLGLIALSLCVSWCWVY